VYSAERLRQLGEVLEEHPRVVVLSDDIYEHISWADEPFVSFAAACPSLYDRTLTVNGFSKGYAMSGWRLGYAAGPVPLIRAMTTIQGQSTTNACTISQAAGVAALTGNQAPVRDMCRIFEERHAHAYGCIDAIEGFETARGRGAFYLFPKIVEAMRRKGLADDVEFCEALLEAQGVALVPGSAFGAPGHLRISFATSKETLAEAARRMQAFVAA
jgi:aspartate aminotransferase